MNDQSLVRIGVFYDGNYFLHVSNYYAFVHSKKSRISIAGLHEFIRSEVAREFSMDYRLCQVVDAHFFRGRMSAQDAQDASDNMLYNERVFDDILMYEGVVTHYLPLKTRAGKKEEKGIDVWLALEAFELAFYKKFDTLVLIAGDGDYMPLIRKLNTLGTKVMLLSWDFEYTNSNGETKTTRTSQDLLEEVSYPIAMHELIENRVRKNETTIDNLFVKKTYSPKQPSTQNKLLKSTIITLKNGFGFIKYPPDNLFFHYSRVSDGRYDELKVGDNVNFRLGKNNKQEDIAVDVSLAEE